MGNISHFGINCAPSEFDKVLEWYLAALKPLGYKVLMTPVPQVVGMGNGYAPEFWIAAKPKYEDIELETRKATGTHFAFWGKNFQVVHDFHAAALKAGGTCNGKGGYRPEYFSLYYASFVIDPLGNNVEVMCIYPGWTQLWWWRSWLPGWKGFENVRAVEGKKTD